MPSRFEMSRIYSSQVLYSAGKAEADSNRTKMYRAIVVSTEITRMRKTLLRGNVYSSDACEMFSNPMNAHGEMQAMRRTCERACLSGTNPGSKRCVALPHPSIEATKQTVIPTENRSTSPIRMLIVAFRRLMHNSAMSTIAAIESSASPRYTS